MVVVSEIVKLPFKLAADRLVFPATNPVIVLAILLSSFVHELDE